MIDKQARSVPAEEKLGLPWLRVSGELIHRLLLFSTQRE
jgi:hypothetical protein